MLAENNQTNLTAVDIVEHVTAGIGMHEVTDDLGPAEPGFWLNRQALTIFVVRHTGIMVQSLCMRQEVSCQKTG